MSNIYVGEIPSSRWEEYKALRLHALATEPQAFGSSHEEKVKLPDESWIKKIENHEVLFALVDDELVGMVGYWFESRTKTRHIALIFGAFVKKEHRGKGIGKLLLEAVLKKIQERSEIIKVRLTVSALQEDAIRLYKKYGFKKVGVLKKEIKIEKQYYDKILMAKFIQ